MPPVSRRTRPVVLIHGYSDRGESFARWRNVLAARGIHATDISVCTWESLTNEVSIKDVAEGLDRALRTRAGLDADQPFDAIVHSTGMLVIRAWLTTYAERRDRLRHLIALAPATFGSPLAHKGRSWLGALFKGNREWGPDFLEAGDLILDGLELGSRYTWDLAHLDLLGAAPMYGPTGSTPYAFVFCGNVPYRGLKRLIGEAGTDGVVRLAGCALNTRKIVVDLTRDSARSAGTDRTRVEPWSNVDDLPLHVVNGADHGSILADPPDPLIELVVAALGVNTRAQYDAWRTDADRRLGAGRTKTDAWQQFVIRVIDERNDPVRDWNLQILAGDERRLDAFDADVHTYRSDPSLRSFHVNLSKLRITSRTRLRLRLIASSGSTLVGYHGVGSEKITLTSAPAADPGKWDAQLDLSPTIGDQGVKLFFPFTTTLVEIRINREPLPLSGENRVTRWIA